MTCTNVYPELSRPSSARQVSAFTLIELLLVLVILAVLAAIIIPKFTGRAEQARESAAKQDISSLKVALDTFEVDCGRFPTSAEGLAALVERPGDLVGWRNPYIDKLRKDPWSHDYIYRAPGNNGRDYDLLSAGPDGVEGGADDVSP